MAQTEVSKAVADALPLETEVKSIGMDQTGLQTYSDGAGGAVVIYPRTLTNDELQDVQGTLDAHVVADPLVNYIELVGANDDPIIQVRGPSSPVGLAIRTINGPDVVFHANSNDITIYNKLDAAAFVLNAGDEANQNYLEFRAGTADNPQISAVGLTAPDVDLLIQTTGTGRLKVNEVVVSTISSTDTLTNKTIALGSNTLTGTSAQLATAISDETGTGALVFATTPTLVTPVLGVATATSINKVAITAPATSATLTLADGTTVTGPAASGTLMTLNNAETITSVKTFSGTTQVRFTDLNARIRAASSGNMEIIGSTSILLSTAKVTLSDGLNIAINVTTGSKIGTGTTQKIGFWNATPVVQPAAYTQTYATANRTHPALTSAAAAGTATLAGYGCVSAAEFNTLVANITAIRTDLTSLKDLVNSLIDDAQSIGLAG